MSRREILGLVVGLGVAVGVALIPTSTGTWDCGSVLAPETFSSAPDDAPFEEIMGQVRAKSCDQARQPYLVVSVATGLAVVGWGGWRLGSASRREESRGTP